MLVTDVGDNFKMSVTVLAILSAKSNNFRQLKSHQHHYHRSWTKDCMISIDKSSIFNGTEAHIITSIISFKDCSEWVEGY